MTNWQTKRLGDVTTLIKDGTHGTHSDVSMGIPLLSAKDVNNGKVNIADDARIISEDDFNAIHKGYKLQNGDVLLTIVGSLGRVAMVDDYDDSYTFQRSVAILRFGDAVNKKFAYHTLSEGAFQRELLKRESKGAQGGVYLGDISKIKIQIPEKPEQERIVGVLEVWDEYIEKLEQKIALKEQLKKGLMQQLLTGKRRLPGYSGEWQSKKLGDLVEIKKGSGLSKDLITESGSKCVLYGEIYTKYDEIIDEVYSRTRSRNGVKSKSGDVLVPASTTTSNLDIATATSVHEDGILLGGDINILRPKISVNSKFLSMLLSGPEKINLAKRAQGITIVHLYGKDFIKMKISLPSKEEQDAIVRVIETVRDEIKCHEPVLDNLKLQKKYLLKNLITGSIRTPEDLQPLDTSRLERSAL